MKSGWRRAGLVGRTTVFLLAIWFSLTGCTGGFLPEKEIIPSNTPTVTTTSTPTTVWFPPTITPTPKPPTPQPSVTPEMHPSLDEIVISDSFTTENNWQTRRTLAGNISTGYGELTIAVAQPKVTLYSLRQGYFPDDYYLEITAHPSLCRAGDMYGLLLRASSEQEYYRFSLNCAGQIRLDWFKGGSSFPLYNWEMSGQLQPGPFASPQLGVWVKEDEMRFFIDDVYQFKVDNLAVTEGKVGVFGRAVGETAMTVNFSELQVWSLSD